MAFNIRKVFGRQSAGDSSATATQERADDGLPTAETDEGPVAVLKTKTKSNQSNDRQSQEADPTAAADGAPEGVVQYNESDLQFERAAGGGGADPQATGPIRLDPTPAGPAAGINTTKSNTFRTAEADTAGGGVEGDADLARTVTKTSSNIQNNRTGQEDDPAAADLDGDGTLDEGPVSVLKNKTKSNQSNDRLGHEDDPAAVAGAGGGTLDDGPVAGLTSKTYDQKTNDRGDRLAQEEDGPDAGGGGIPSPVESANLNLSKSNINLAPVGGATDDGDASAGLAVNLNSSKSNTYRAEGGSSEGGEDPAAAAINTSHSNIKNLAATGPEGGGGGIPEPVEASNLNLSKSNINRAGGDAGAGEDPGDPVAMEKGTVKFFSDKKGMAERGGGADSAGLTDGGDPGGAATGAGVRESPSRASGGKTSDRLAEEDAPGEGGDPAAINNTKSNIKNRTGEPDSGGGAVAVNDGEEGAFAINEQGAGGRVFPETNNRETAPRDVMTGQSSGKAVGEKDHGSQVAADSENVERTAGHEAAHTVQQGAGGPPVTAREASSGMATGKAVGEKDHGSQVAAADDGGVTHEDDWETPTARESPSRASGGSTTLREGDPGDPSDGDADGDDIPGRAGLRESPSHLKDRTKPPAGARQGEDSVAGSDDGGPQMADSARQKTWLTSNFREQTGDDDEGPSTLLDLSGSADGAEAGAMVDLDLDGLPDAAGVDLDADADAAGVDLEELMADA